MNTPLLKLGYWNPVIKDEPHLPDLVMFCAASGWSAVNWDLRSPQANLHNYSLKGELGVRIWHNDGDPFYDSDPLCLIFWANLSPTEIQLPNGSIYIPGECEVVVVNNNVCKHKMPDQLDPGRWFTRGWRAKEDVWTKNAGK